MKTEYKIIAGSVMLAVCIGVIDVMLDRFMFFQEGSWRRLLPHEIYTWSLLFGSFLIFGALMARIVGKNTQIEHALRVSEERYRELFDNMSSGVAVYDARADGADFVIKDFNKAGERITNVNKAAILGKTVTEVFPGVQAFGLFDVFRRVWETGQPARHPVSQYTDRQLSFWTDNYVYKLPTGEIVAVYDDVTERKLAEESLRASENRYKIVSELMSDYVFKLSIDVAGRVVMDWVSENFSAITGRTLADAKTPDLWTKIIYPDDLHKVRELLYRLVSSKQTGELECRSFVNGSTLRWVHILARSEWDAVQQRVIGIVGAVKDISDRKRAEEEIRTLNAELEARVKQRMAELEAVNAELKSFAYIVSHDLKAPLRGINQLVHWLLEDYAAAFDVKGREMLDLLIGRVRRMDKLIDGILQYSRAGRIADNAESIVLNPLVHEILDLLSPPQHLQITVSPDLPVIVADKTRLTQVFQNLLSNAVKFMDKPRGQVSVGCVETDTHWTFHVTDNGPGIDPKDHAKIFEIFQTLTPRDISESTGVGLAIVKKIVEFYGGQIWVESTPGQGSTFWFTFPKKS